MTSQQSSLVAMYGMKRKLHSVALLWLCVVQSVMTQSPNITTTIDNNNNGRVQSLKLTDLTGSATAKSYEPPPEFYRGPASTTGLDNTGVGFISKATIEPLSGGGGAYNKWQPNYAYGSGTGGSSGIGGSPVQQRISVGHYGSSGATHGNAGYAYEGHPYEFAHGTQYGGSSVSSSSSSHYGGAPGGGYYGSSAETVVPFDVYGGRPGHGGHSGGGGHYAVGDYGYSSYPVEGHDIATHKGSSELSQKSLLAKSFLIPLASAAVLGIAAALVSNPLLLQLGTVSGVGVGPTLVGKRKRRSLRRHKKYYL